MEEAIDKRHRLNQALIESMEAKGFTFDPPGLNSTLTFKKGAKSVTIDVTSEEQIQLALAPSTPSPKKSTKKKTTKKKVVSK